MQTLFVLLNIMGPIAFVVLLGVLAGRTGVVKPEANEAFSTLALRFCLPALMFNATAAMPLSELTNWRLFVGLLLGLVAVYLLGLFLGLFAFKRTLPESTMEAINAGGPDLAAIGVPLLLAVVGKAAILTVVIGNAFASFVLIPVSLVMLSTGGKDPNKPLGALVRSAFLNALGNPLVWAPAAGIVFALLHVPLPAVVSKCCTMIGEALAGVSLFAMGLFLTGRKIQVNTEVLVNVGLKLVAQPAAMLVFALLLGVSGESRREMILLGALPTGHHRRHLRHPVQNLRRRDGKQCAAQRRCFGRDHRGLGRANPTVGLTGCTQDPGRTELATAAVTKLISPVQS